MKLRHLGLLLILVVAAWPQGRQTVEVDTGNCALSGTYCGGIGFTAPDTGQGVGFQYPKYAPSVLYYGGYLVGSSATTVHDHFYGQPATNLHWDWVVRDTFVDVIPPRFGAHELYVGTWVDTTRPTAAEGYLVRHFWGGRGAPLDAYDDFVIFDTWVKNISSQQRTGVYVGVMCDFDLGTAPTTNWGRTDATRRLTYMWPSSSNQNPSVGVKLLYPTTAANLSLIDHALYVYPPSQMTEQTKINFLNGTIRLPNSTRAYDYSILVSAGPFTLRANDSVRVAFAILGAGDSLTLKVHADTAQRWFDREWIVGIEEEAGKNLTNLEGIKILPNPFGRSTRIYYTFSKQGKVTIKAYDASGREVATILNRLVDKNGYIDWFVNDLPNGVYFLKIETQDKVYTRKVLLLQ